MTNIATDNNDIEVETPQRDAANTVVQDPGDIAQHIPSAALSTDSHEITADLFQESNTPILEEVETAVVASQSSSAGAAEENSQANQIPLHRKLYDAAVAGDVDSLKHILEDSQKNDELSLLQGVSTGLNNLLHIVATSSNRYLRKRRTSSSYVDFAEEVYKRNKSLLMARNKMMETPLHCATKSGNYEMTSCLISFAENAKDWNMDVAENFLTARNFHAETALHEAVRVGHIQMVEKLIRSAPRLTGIDNAEGISPLYLAAMSNVFEIVKKFTKQDPTMVSCGGPKGQTALHAAVLEHGGITRELLEWNNSLATKVDDFKSTPLHYAASAGHQDIVKLLLEHDTSAAYMTDTNGLYPIHVAAKCGRYNVIELMARTCPDSDELLDKEGRNFLHFAIINNQCPIIAYNTTYLRMLNARDYQGNTPLHLACEKGFYTFVSFLISMKMVHSTTMNRDSLTPVDLAMKKLDSGFRYLLNKEYNILRCMVWSGALPSARREDHLHDDLGFQHWDKEKELDKLKSATRSSSIVSVLISTITFSAIFSIPGGYIADDHHHGGTPIHSTKYTFKAFLVADLLAFILSMGATAWLIFAGTTVVDIDLRSICVTLSQLMIRFAAKATVCAFALASYTVLSQVNLGISILFCVVTFGLLPFGDPSLFGYTILALPMVKRLGCIGLFRSGYLSSTQRRLSFGLGSSYCSGVMVFIIEHLTLYAIIFLFALL